MTVIVLVRCPEGLRGYLTRWMMEIAAGVFVGDVNARVRDFLWEKVTELCKDGRALLVYKDSSQEQGLAFRTHLHEWEPVDVDGVTLIMRPSSKSKPAMRRGWSKAAKLRKYGR